MSVKHVKEYYQQISDQYNEMLENIKDCEENLVGSVIEPEYVDRLKEQIKPIKDNYMTISWIMYLLNQPNRSSKEKAYIDRNKRLLAGLDKEFSTQSKIVENEKILNSMETRK